MFFWWEVSSFTWTGIVISQHRLKVEAQWAVGGVSADGWKRGGTCKCVCFSNDCFPVFSSVFFLEWHQYDDIVCAKPPKFANLKSLWGILPHDETKNIVKGKIIAANIMLENIFSILGTWSPDNLRNFLFQLRQFYVVTIDPTVHDSGAVRWAELNFGAQQVICLLFTNAREETFSY